MLSNCSEKVTYSGKIFKEVKVDYSKIKTNQDMINLIGCNKENFFKLLELMQYKRKKAEENKEDLFIYKPKYIKKNISKSDDKPGKNNPFDKLMELRFR